MYRKRDCGQMTVEDFVTPFGGKLDARNRWVKQHGAYPKAILADKTYRNRKNIEFCRRHGIRLPKPRLGRPKASEFEADRGQAYQDNCGRNVVEGRIGIGKRRYGLYLILSRTELTAKLRPR